MKLGDKQRLFVSLLPQLIKYAYSQGYELTLGHALRCEGCKVGRKYSNHKNKLAIDLNLFKDGVYLTSTKDHKFLGEYWESMHPLCSWGGRFNDGNHYSLEHEGRR